MIKKLGSWGLLGLALGLCATAAVWAQEKRPAATTVAATGGRSMRIAMLNMQEVLKGYQKFVTIRDQIKEKAEGYDRSIKNKMTRLEELEKKYKDPKTAQEEKDRVEREARQIRLEIEDVKVQARKELQRLEQDQLSQIYREVNQVVEEYAKANGIDLVLRYSENWDAKYWEPAAVVQRLSQPFWPMYYDREKGIDITGQISEMLNRKYAGAAPAANVKPAGFKKEQ